MQHNNSSQLAFGVSLFCATTDLISLCVCLCVDVDVDACPLSLLSPLICSLLSALSHLSLPFSYSLTIVCKASSSLLLFSRPGRPRRSRWHRLKSHWIELAISFFIFSLVPFMSSKHALCSLCLINCLFSHLQWMLSIASRFSCLRFLFLLLSLILPQSARL